MAAFSIQTKSEKKPGGDAVKRHTRARSTDYLLSVSASILLHGLLFFLPLDTVIPPKSMKSQAVSLRVWVEERNADNMEPKIRRIEKEALRAEDKSEKKKDEMKEIAGETESPDMPDIPADSYMPAPAIIELSAEQNGTKKMLPIPDFSKKLLDLPLVQKSEVVAEIAHDEPPLSLEGESDATDTPPQASSNVDAPAEESGVSVTGFSSGGQKKDMPLPVSAFSKNAFLSSLAGIGERSPELGAQDKEKKADSEPVNPGQEQQAPADGEHEIEARSEDRAEQGLIVSESPKDFSAGPGDGFSSPELKSYQTPLPDLKKKILAFSPMPARDVDAKGGGSMEAGIPPPRLSPMEEEIEHVIEEENAGIGEVVSDSPSSPIPSSTVLSRENAVDRGVSKGVEGPESSDTVESLTKQDNAEPQTPVTADGGSGDGGSSDSDSSDGGLGAEEVDAAEEPPYSYVAAAIEYLRRGIEERKTYPEAARRRKTEGRVRILVQILPNGERASGKVIKRSGSAILDKAAAALVDSLFPVAPAPGEKIEVVLEIVYELQ